jgi:hypothetical protein
MPARRNILLNLLISGLSIVLRENTLALGKAILPRLQYGKAIAIASILVARFPTTATTKKFYDSARPRWNPNFVFRLNPFCPLSKLFALTGLYHPEMTEALLTGPYRGSFVDIGANLGYFSVLWLSTQTGEVLALEPINQNFELLTANLQLFGSRAKTVMCCLADSGVK